MNKYKSLRANSIIFIFKYDDSAPELLHIYARHLTGPKDAIYTFFSGEPSWNQERERFETLSETYGLYWFWLEKNKKVMIIGCFKL